MKIKIFSHKSDPDGIGGPILASLAYRGGSITLCKGMEELDVALEVFMHEQEYKEYEKIFITDLCPSNSCLDRIDGLEELKKKIFIFDHHQSAIDRIPKEYSFLVEKIEENREPCCGTSLFYQYLVDHHVLEAKDCIKSFVALTRAIDLYDFTEENKELAYALQLIYQFLGPWGYYYHFLEKCKKEDYFSYTEEEQVFITTQQLENQKKIEDLYDKMLLREIDGICYGVFVTNYAYRNVLADYIKEKSKVVDAMLLIAGDEERFSFRSIHEDIDVNRVAEICGGGGHTKAAGGELNQDTLERILKFLK